MEADSPWESMRAEQENGELLSVDERDEAAKDDKDDDAKGSVKEARSEKCSDRVLHCLSQVPCASLIAWIILLTGLGGVTGSLLIGTRRTRELLLDDKFLWFMEYTLIGVVIGMFVIGTTLLCVGHISTDPTSRHLFHSSKKNYCAQGLNIVMLILSYFLGVVWILVTAIIGVPLFLLLNLTLIRDNVECINLVSYGFNNREICRDALDVFEREGSQLMVSYIAAFISSVLIAISMPYNYKTKGKKRASKSLRRNQELRKTKIHFMIAISANIAHLKESRVATLNAYDVEETQNAKHSMVADTSM